MTHDIAAVIYRYSLALDTRDWALMDEVFLSDAEIHLGETIFLGRERGVAAIRACIECCSVTHHMNSNVLATIDGDRAKVCANFRAWHRGREARSAETFEAMGHYFDDFVRSPQGWRIAKRVELGPIMLGDLNFFSAAASRMAELASK